MRTAALCAAPLAPSTKLSGGRSARRPSRAVRVPAAAAAEAPAIEDVPLHVKGVHLEITPSIQKYAEDKVMRALTHYTGYVTNVSIRCTARGHPREKGPPRHKAEITVRTKGRGLVRGEMTCEDLYESLDKSAHKVERSLRKMKERMKGKLGGVQHMAPHIPAAELVTDELVSEYPLWMDYDEPELPMQVSRTKYFTLTPMDEQKAIEQLEQLGHKFYVFQSSSSGRTEILYRREDGSIGRIVPMLEA